MTHEAKGITRPEMVAFLQDLAARHPETETIHGVLDNATCNRAATVRAWLAMPGCRLRLVYLPPHAPNPNLTEWLRWLFKKTPLRNHHYPTLAEVRAAIHAFFADLTPGREELVSLITNRFHFIGAEPTQIQAAQGFTGRPCSLACGRPATGGTPQPYQRSTTWAAGKRRHLRGTACISRPAP
ncbi:transposase [Roseicella aquatilis]|uniref:Tc1-like transposase DDE domain-containing protein n=1 Tax=Roseicella aquatilis TaxID=2527868 RepID=A0A4R4DT23_9PROT|nr:transposase [Roseicella aquatilis]TCZ64980.1 hypothetical protein EXY23_06315 [Roseicella aquatilis]